MRQSFNLNFYCRASKSQKNGYAPLELSININGERKFVQLPYKCLPSDFNRKRQPKELIDYQASMRKRVNEILNEMISEQVPLTTQNLKEYLKNGGYKSYTVENLFDEYLTILDKRMGSTITKSVFLKYILVRDLFYTVIDKNSECTAITPSHVQNFKVICESKYKASTTAGYLTKLKTVLTYGKDNGKLKTNPFVGIKITKGNKDITYLTEKELNILENAEFNNDSLNNVRDCFLFECYSGISYADLKHIKPQDFKYQNGVWYIQGIRQKTGKEYTAVLLPNFVNLIEAEEKNCPEKDEKNCPEKNENNCSKKNEDENCWEEGKPLKIKDLRFKMITNQKENAYLHAIEQILGFPRPLTTHLARHTYATLLANKYKCRMEVVASALGDSLKITTKHYAKFLSETTIQEIGKNIKSVG